MIDGTNYIIQKCACGYENSTSQCAPKKSAKDIAKDATPAIYVPQLKHYANTSKLSNFE